MAPRTAKQNTDREPGGNVETLGQTAKIVNGAEAVMPNGTLVVYDASMAEVTMAKRLYEVWRTVGQLGDPKWEWSKQSDQSHAAWIAVARAASPAVMQKHWGPHEIASVNHA